MNARLYMLRRKLRNPRCLINLHRVPRKRHTKHGHWLPQSARWHFGLTYPRCINCGECKL